MASRSAPHARSGDDGGDAQDPTGPADQELVEQLRRGENAAARELYLRYYDRLLRFAYGYVHAREAAEEVVQDVFLAILERREQLELREGIRTYLYAAVRNRALKVIEHDRVVARAEGEAAEDTEGQVPGMGARAVAPDARLEADALAAAVARAIAALPEKRRIALTLRWRHQLPYAEIARIMGTSVAAVTIQVARARETIALSIREYTERSVGP